LRRPARWCIGIEPIAEMRERPGRTSPRAAFEPGFRGNSSKSEKATRSPSRRRCQCRVAAQKRSSTVSTEAELRSALSEVHRVMVPTPIRLSEFLLLFFFFFDFSLFFFFSGDAGAA